MSRPEPDTRRESRPVAFLSDWHAPDCTCPSCVAEDPLDTPVATSPVGLFVALGFSTGVALCALIDLVTGRHGVLLMLGLAS